MRVGILALVLSLIMSPAQASMFLFFDGKVTSFTDEWVTIETGKLTYTLDKSKLSASDLKQITGVNAKVSLAIPVESLIEAHTSSAK